MSFDVFAKLGSSVDIPSNIVSSIINKIDSDNKVFTKITNISSHEYSYDNIVDAVLNNSDPRVVMKYDYDQKLIDASSVDSIADSDNVSLIKYEINDNGGLLLFIRQYFVDNYNKSTVLAINAGAYANDNKAWVNDCVLSLSINDNNVDLDSKIEVAGYDSIYEFSRYYLSDTILVNVTDYTNDININYDLSIEYPSIHGLPSTSSVKACYHPELPDNTECRIYYEIEKVDTTSASIILGSSTILDHIEVSINDNEYANIDTPSLSIEKGLCRLEIVGLDPCSNNKVLIKSKSLINNIFTTITSIDFQTNNPEPLKLVLSTHNISTDNAIVTLSLDSNNIVNRGISLVEYKYSNKRKWNVLDYSSTPINTLSDLPCSISLSELSPSTEYTLQVRVTDTYNILSDKFAISFVTLPSIPFISSSITNITDSGFTIDLSLSDTTLIYESTSEVIDHGSKMGYSIVSSNSNNSSDNDSESSNNDDTNTTIANIAHETSTLKSSTSQIISTKWSIDSITYEYLGYVGHIQVINLLSDTVYNVSVTLKDYLDREVTYITLVETLPVAPKILNASLLLDSNSNLLINSDVLLGKNTEVSRILALDSDGNEVNDLSLNATSINSIVAEDSLGRSSEPYAVDDVAWNTWSSEPTLAYSYVTKNLIKFRITGTLTNPLTLPGMMSVNCRLSLGGSNVGYLSQINTPVISTGITEVDEVVTMMLPQSIDPGVAVSGATTDGSQVIVSISPDTTESSYENTVLPVSISLSTYYLEDSLEITEYCSTIDYEYNSSSKTVRVDVTPMINYLGDNPNETIKLYMEYELSINDNSVGKISTNEVVITKDNYDKVKYYVEYYPVNIGDSVLLGPVDTTITQMTTTGESVIVKDHQDTQLLISSVEDSYYKFVIVDNTGSTHECDAYIIDGDKVVQLTSSNVTIL